MIIIFIILINGFINKLRTIYTFQVKTQATDGYNLFVNPQFTYNLDLTGKVFVMAHEIMHCFGAYDLYYASSAIPQAYVDHCRITDSNDIMYTVSLGTTIPQLFTQLDAYYLGLVDSCDEVDTWGLGKSSFLD